MNDPKQSLRILAILADADHEAFAATATVARYASQDAGVTVADVSPGDADADQVICELVAQIRRLRPNVVITSGPWDGSNGADRVAISQLATAAVMRAADPRYGHTCCCRGAHAVSKLYYTAADGPITTRIDSDGQQPADTYYRAFSTVNCERSLETDLFEGIRRSIGLIAVAA